MTFNIKEWGCRMVATEGSRTVEKALVLMDYFSIGQAELTLAEIHQLSGQPSSTLFRILTTLHRCSFLKYDEKTRQYSPGIKFIRLGFMASDAMDIYKISKPYMNELKNLTGETISLFIKRGLHKVCIGTVESDYAVRYAARRGEEIPLYVGASGKVLLSRLRDQEIEGIVSELGFVWKSPNADRSLEHVMEKIRFVRGNGYAMSLGERRVGSASLGVPLTDFKGNVLASFNISLPAERVRSDVLPKWIHVLKNTGVQISQKLGGKE